MASVLQLDVNGRLQSVTISYSDVGAAATVHTHASSQINIDVSGIPTYKTLQDFVDIIESSGRLDGGAITSNGDGTVAITSMRLMCRTTNAFNGDMVFYDMPLVASVTLVDQTLNYIYLDWNSGTPRYLSTTDETTINLYNQFTVGRAYRHGNSVDVIQTGINLYNQHRRNGDRLITKYGFERATGSLMAEVGVRYLSVTQGAWYIRNTQIITPAFDSSNAAFEHVFYRNGSNGWTDVSNVQQLDNNQYDNGTGTLAAVQNGHYGVYWVYQCPNGGVSIVYGQGSYTSTALPSSPPSTLPTYISANWANLIGMLVFVKNGPHFTQISSAFTVNFALTTVIDHNDLGNLQGGTASQYYHLTSAQYSALGSSGFYLTFSGTNDTSIPFVLGRWTQVGTTVNYTFASTGNVARNVLTGYAVLYDLTAASVTATITWVGVINPTAGTPVNITLIAGHVYEFRLYVTGGNGAGSGDYVIATVTLSPT